MSDESDKAAADAAESAKLDMHVLKAKAVREATFEVLGEQRAEIIRRARAKLTAQGVRLSDEDVP